MEHEAFERFKERSSHGGLFLDFDGTLSEIVAVPSDARPFEGVPDLLAGLARKLKLVAVVSGRSAHQILEWLGPDVEIWGLHGAERTVAGTVELAESARPYEATMKRVHREAQGILDGVDLKGVVLEDKGVMLTFHYRTASDRSRAEKELDGIVAGLAEAHGLVRNFGKMAFELQPPIGFSKRAVVLQRSREESLQAVGFAGDDVVDLPGYDAVDELEQEGAVALRIAVDSAGSPVSLIERADVVVSGPSGLVTLLRELL